MAFIIDFSTNIFENYSVNKYFSFIIVLFWVNYLRVKELSKICGILTFISKLNNYSIAVGVSYYNFYQWEKKNEASELKEIEI